MDLKNAVAVCLISLCSATLVVLIARSLDSQAASQLEPQLTGIAKELRMLRKQGGVAAAPGVLNAAESVGDGLVVYYFHSSYRCPNCRAVESQAHETLEADFSPQLDRGEIVWKVLNYEKPASAAIVRKFDVKDPVVVLARMKDDQMQEWKRLDKVLALVGDKPAFTKYVREEIERMLADKQPMPPETQTPGPAIPAPSAEGAPAKETPAIPIP
jgi:hypothetical protein